MKNKQLKISVERVKLLSEMVTENSFLYLIEKDESKYIPIAGTTFPKNSNYSKTAIESQIVTLRNELLNLKKLL